MKNIFKYIALTAVAAMSAACAQDYPELSQGNLPQASALNAVITVDQATNYATFNVSNPGVVPIWIFGSELIDGKAGKSYAYVGNNITLRFREAGKHTVEVKAYNANGISEGSIVETFEMKDTYRDPFDPAPYINALSGGSSQEWVWNSVVDGHFGCGPVGNPLEWWQCPAGGKTGFLYDDVMTFGSDGSYTFDPGESGQAYAKGDAEYPAGHAIESDDYLFPAQKATTSFSFENNWNDAGIEEIFLTLAPGSILSYVPHKSLVDEPRYQVLETSTGAMKKALKLMATVYTPNNGDGISYYYEFVPKSSLEPEEEGDDTFYDVNGPSNLWRSATITPDLFYTGGGWDGALTAGTQYEVLENNGYKVTIPDGIGGEEWKGQNKLKSGIATSSDKLYDFSVTLTADADMTITIKLTSDPEEDNDIHAFFYDGNVQLDKGETITYTKSGLSQKVSADNLMLIFDYGRSPEGSTITATDICFQEHISKSAEIDLDSKDNLWRAASITPDLFYTTADNWNGELTAGTKYEILENNGYKVTIPDGIGGQEWKGQNKLKSGIATSSDKLYDFTVTLTADENMTVTIKLTSDPEEDNDIHAFFYDGNVQLDKGESLTYTKTVISQKVSADNLMLIFDYGRSPAGSTITATDICFQEHKNKAMAPAQ